MRWMGAFAVVFSVLLQGSLVLANDPPTKLNRGVRNTLFGWNEVEETVKQRTEETNWFEGLTAGLAHGFGRFIARTGAGIYETATFFIPYPEDYKPLMKEKK